MDSEFFLKKIRPPIDGVFGFKVFFYKASQRGCFGEGSGAHFFDVGGCSFFGGPV